MNRRLKVLISAYACNPRMGSEAGIGWGFARTIARMHDVWVLTDLRHRKDIEAEVTACPDRYAGMRFHYIPRTRWRLAEKLWPPAYLWTYELWQRDAYRAGAALHDRAGFDIAHMVTYGTFRSPGYLWKLGIPFVCGPIEALDNTPWRFLPMMGFAGCLHFAGRNVVNALHKMFLPGPRQAFHRAAALIAASSGMQQQIRKWYARDSEVICEIGPPPVIATDFTRRGPDEPLRVAWSGLHIPRKALPLLLGALRRLGNQADWQLDVLGEGPCTTQWMQYARQAGIDKRIRWHGRIPRDKAVEIVHSSHLFVITSLHDMTSSVLIEALSQGQPVLCGDHCGFTDVVTRDCGVRIPVQTRTQFENDLAAAILHLATDEDRRRKLAAGALERVRYFSWEGKERKIKAIYDRICGEVPVAR